MDEKPMRNLRASLKSFVHDERGITVVEYAIGAGLISASIVAGLMALGLSITRILMTLVGFMTP